MDDLGLTILILIVIALIVAAIVLPIVALIVSLRSRHKLNERLQHLQAPSGSGVDLQEIRNSDLARLANALQQLAARVEHLETVLATRPVPMEGTRAPETHVETPAPVGTPPETPAPTQPAPPPQPAETREEPTFSPIITTSRTGAQRAEGIESIIGRRWLGWVAVGLILFATAFFLKYAFDNRWIGELGRVTIGIVAGVGLAVMGFKYHRRGWRIFSQILTSGAVVLLYLSVYAAFGYYHLVTQQAAFVFLIILVAEAAALALLYDAPAIAIMALIGGFLSPLLLRSDRDQYRTFFGYLAVLDIGALAMLKHWPGLNSLAFAGTHLLFWLWYADHYHPRKLSAVMVFQTVVFLLFLLAYLGRRLLRKERATLEDFGLLPINAFVFFVTAYGLLDPNHHEWMGALAIVMGLVYALAAKVMLDRAESSRGEVLTMIAVALTFVTLAIPIQLKANWITIAWAVEALTMLWAGTKINSVRLHITGGVLFALALGKLLLWDTAVFYRTTFPGILNKYFLSSLAVVACLFGATALYQKLDKTQHPFAEWVKLVFLLVAIGTLWLVMSVETHLYFSVRAANMKSSEELRYDWWMGQMALSVLWSIYAAVLMAVGFLRRSAVLRWSALFLFGLTVMKVLLVDLEQLKQLYRIIAFLVLGVVLLAVAWGYQKVFRAKESST